MSAIREFARQVDEGAVPDATRRRLLRTATGIAGGAGLLAAAYPFVASLAPSERAKALGGPVQVELATLAVGDLRTVEWRGMPVWLMRRSEPMVRALRWPPGRRRLERGASRPRRIRVPLPRFAL